MSQSAAAREPVTAAVTPVTVELVDRHGRGTVVEVELRYLAEDPWAVSIAVPTTVGPVVWCFARDLLEHGVFTPAGDGDVHVWPSLSASGVSVTLVELAGADGRTVHLEIPSRAVLHFLDAAAEVVAPGSESSHLDLEGLVGELLDTPR